MIRKRGLAGTRVAGALALACAFAAPARALDPGKPLGRCSLAVWRARDGLPGPWVRAIAQTPDGHLWVATYGGLVRSDGARFVPIGVGTFPTLNDVLDMAVGPGGELWLTTSSGDPLCVRGEAVERCLPAGAHLPSQSRLSALGLDPTGGAWMATRDRLLRFRERRLSTLGWIAGGDHPEPRLPFDQVAALLVDGAGPWVGTDRGLFQGSPLRPVQGVSGLVSALARAAEGGLWVATPGGLVRMSPGDAPALYSEGYPSGRVGRLVEDRHGSLWLAAGGGLTRFREGRFETFTTRDGLPDDHVTTVFEDREGTLWVGTRGGGLAQFTDRTLDTQVGPPGLRDQQVSAVAEDETGAVWLGTREGLYRWQAGGARRFTTAEGLPSDRVNSVLPDGAGVWVGTDGGLVRWRGDGPVLRGVHDGLVNALYRDQAGALWIGGRGVALRWQDGRSERFEIHRGLKNLVRAFGEDDRGEMWIAALGGIGHLEGRRFEEIASVGGVHVDTARSVHRDRRGALWISSNAGLVRRAGGQLRLLAGVDLGVTGQIYQVQSEEDGHLWVGTTRGLARLDPAALDGTAQRRPPFSMLVLDTSDRRRDAAATGTRQPGAWRMRDGRFWFGSDQGLLAIDPRRLPIDTLAPSVVIERALLDGRPTAPGTTTALPPGPGNLEFHFAAITLVDAHRAQHRYRLEGYDRDWVEAGTRRVAQYTNLPPGHYRFRVQGSNADGVWSEARETVSFSLAPRFYVTLWFRALVVATIAALAFLLYRLRLRGLRRAYLAAFEERSRLARELHDTLLQGMSAIGMTLRGIRRRLEPKAPATARELETVEDMVTMSLDETRRFVWNLREQGRSSGDLGVALGLLADRLTQGRPITCHARVEGEARPLPNGTQDQLFRIAQEAMANAVKHAQASRIEVALAFEPDRVRLSVTDDGCGFDPALAQGAQAGHFGLAGMRERAQRLGPLVIDSRPGAGTRVEITVPVTGKERERADA